MSIATITPQELSRLQQQNTGMRILDVRSPAEFEAVHATTADNVPLDQLNPSAYLANHSVNGDPIYVICKMGGRSLKACEQLEAAGHANVVNITGGTDAWVAAGLPHVEGEGKIMPIDCQVRVMAGSLVAIGALLAFVHPAWALLSLFIGCGLVYSGITNTCGMAAVLAGMPWNQAKKKSDLSVVCDDGG